MARAAATSRESKDKSEIADRIFLIVLAGFFLGTDHLTDKATPAFFFNRFFLRNRFYSFLFLRF